MKLVNSDYLDASASSLVIQEERKSTAAARSRAVTDASAAAGACAQSLGSILPPRSDRASGSRRG